jgi:Reverse transcriptase (RNA-dependent DNA polymerase)
MNTVRIFFSLAVNQNWTLYQLDVRNIFLQGTLEEEVYMMFPLRHKEEGNVNIVCKLNKAIYGLKQSPRAWYEKLSNYLFFCDLKVTNADHSLFFKIDKNYTIIILVYVDNIIITGNTLEETRKVKSQLKEKIDIKELGLLKYFLGIKIARSLKGLFISQRKYV